MRSRSSGDFDYDHLARTWDPWKPIPKRYNLGTALTRGNVAAARGERVVRTRENPASGGVYPRRLGGNFPSSPSVNRPQPLG